MNKQFFTQFLSDKPVAFRPDIARAVGGVQAGLFLCQFMYWMDKGMDSEGWIYKTKQELEQETALTRHEQDTARNRLEKLKCIETKRMKPKGCSSSVLHYRVNIEAVLETLKNYYEIKSQELEKPDIGVGKAENRFSSITEITTENTTESTTGLKNSDNNKIFPLVNVPDADQIGKIRSTYSDFEKTVKKRGDQLRNKIHAMDSKIEQERFEIINRESYKVAGEYRAYQAFLVAQETLFNHGSGMYKRARKALASYNGKVDEYINILLDLEYDIKDYSSWFAEEFSKSQWAASNKVAFSWGLFVSSGYLTAYENRNYGKQRAESETDRINKQYKNINWV
jgi:hypothetical protein